MADDLGTPVSVRLPQELHLLLETEARRLSTTVSDVIRQSLLRQLGKPIGWQCPHMDLMAAPGVIVGTPSFPCSCTPEPFFWPAQRRLAASATVRRQHNPGALMEEPDLYGDDPFAAGRLTDAEDPGDRLDAQQPEDGGR